MIVKTFMPQFAPLVQSGKKKHTVRGVPKRERDIPKVGQEISLRTWTGKPYASKQRVLCESTVTRVERILIYSDGILLGGHPLLGEELEDYAKSDGFTTSKDMLAWFDITHGLPFHGIDTYWK